MQQRRYWFGGLVAVLIASVGFFCAWRDKGSIPPEVLIILAVFMICGVWSIAIDLFRINTDGRLSWIIGFSVTAGFAAFAFVVAWRNKTGWSGGLPFLPASWNEALPRILFSFGGLIGVIAAAACLITACSRSSRKRFE